MMLVRRIARPLLAGVFVSRGIELLRTPEEGADAASRLTGAVDAVAPSVRSTLPTDSLTLVRASAAAQVGLGLLLATGRLPRISALGLTAAVLPMTLAEHPFWAQADPARRESEQRALLHDLGLVGGLLLAAVDTAGDPSLAWRARRAARDTGRTTRRAVAGKRREAQLAAQAAGTAVKDTAAAAREKMPV